MDYTKQQVLKRCGASIVQHLELDAIRARLYSEGLLSKHQYQDLLSLRGLNLRASELFLFTYLMHCGKIDGECPFDVFLKVLKMSVKESSCCGHNGIAEKLESELRRAEKSQRLRGSFGGLENSRKPERVEADSVSKHVTVLLMGEEVSHLSLLEEFAQVHQEQLHSTLSTSSANNVYFMHKNPLHGWTGVRVISITSSATVSTEEEKGQHFPEMLSSLEVAPESIQGAVVLVNPAESAQNIEDQLMECKGMLELGTKRPVSLAVLPTSTEQPCPHLHPLLCACGIDSIHFSLDEALLAVLSSVGAQPQALSRGEWLGSDSYSQEQVTVHETHTQRVLKAHTHKVYEPHPQEVSEAHPQEACERHQQEMHKPHPQEVHETHPQEVHRQHVQEITSEQKREVCKESQQEVCAEVEYITEFEDEMEGSFVMISALDPSSLDPSSLRLVRSLPVGGRQEEKQRNALGLSDFHIREKSCVVM